MKKGDDWLILAKKRKIIEWNLENLQTVQKRPETVVVGGVCAENYIDELLSLLTNFSPKKGKVEYHGQI